MSFDFSKLSSVASGGWTTAWPTALLARPPRLVLGRVQQRMHPTVHRRGDVPVKMRVKGEVHAQLAVLLLHLGNAVAGHQGDHLLV